MQSFQIKVLENVCLFDLKNRLNLPEKLFFKQKKKLKVDAKYLKCVLSLKNKIFNKVKSCEQ